jgi:hypothetical protein
LNCKAGATADFYCGGCAFLYGARSGTGAIDTCAAKCGSHGGSFVCLESRVGVALKGLSVFAGESACGGVQGLGVQAGASRSNFTGLKGEWISWPSVAAAICQSGAESSTEGSFLLIANCSEGRGCFYKFSGSAACFRQCLFLDNSVGVIAHSSLTASRDLMKSCCFIKTDLRGNAFRAGSVVVDSCLFGGEVQSTASFIPTGVQKSFAWTQISFDTASLLPKCDEYGKLETPEGTRTPQGRRSRTAIESPSACAAAKSEDAPNERKAESVPAPPEQALPWSVGRSRKVAPFAAVTLGLIALGFLL